MITDATTAAGAPAPRASGTSANSAAVEGFAALLDAARPAQRSADARPVADRGARPERPEPSAEAAPAADTPVPAAPAQAATHADEREHAEARTDPRGPSEPAADVPPPAPLVPGGAPPLDGAPVAPLTPPPAEAVPPTAGVPVLVPPAPVPVAAPATVAGEPVPAAPAAPALPTPAPAVAGLPVAEEPTAPETPSAPVPNVTASAPTPTSAAPDAATSSAVPATPLPVEPRVEPEAGVATPTPTDVPDAAPAIPVGAPATAPAAEAPAEAPEPGPAPAPPVDRGPAPATPFHGGQPAAERAVPLQRVPRTLAQTLQLASERGVTHARLNLRPAELGGVEIRLQSTPAGLAAQVMADSPEAARLLQQSADELRRALQARDVNVIALEVSTSNERRDQAAPGAQAGFGGDERRSGGSGRTSVDADAGDADPSTRETTLELPDGVLVDVLA